MESIEYGIMNIRDGYPIERCCQLGNLLLKC